MFECSCALEQIEKSLSSPSLLKLGFISVFNLETSDKVFYENSVIKFISSLILNLINFSGKLTGGSFFIKEHDLDKMR